MLTDISSDSNGVRTKLGRVWNGSRKGQIHSLFMAGESSKSIAAKLGLDHHSVLSMIAITVNRILRTGRIEMWEKYAITRESSQTSVLSWSCMNVTTQIVLPCLVSIVLLKRTKFRVRYVVMTTPLKREFRTSFRV